MADKTIVRVQKNRENPYVMINKGVFTDDRLSWKAKGLMGYFLSRPDDWRILVSDLIKQSTDGERAVRSGLKELEEFGYLENYPVKDARGRITHWEKVVHECPIEPDVQNSNVDDKPDQRFVHVENVHVENAHVQNAGLLITENNKDRSTQNNEYNNNETVAVVRDEIESYLGVPIHSLVKLLPEWIDVYGRNRLVELAQYIGSTSQKWDNIVGTYRTAVTEVWDIEIQAAPTVAKSTVKDERYRAFYELYPDA